MAREEIPRLPIRRSRLAPERLMAARSAGEAPLYGCSLSAASDSLRECDSVRGRRRASRRRPTVSDRENGFGDDSLEAAGAEGAHAIWRQTGQNSIRSPDAGDGAVASPLAAPSRSAMSASGRRPTASAGSAPSPSILSRPESASRRWVRASSAWASVRIPARSSGAARRTRSLTRVSIPAICSRRRGHQNSSSAPVSAGGATGTGLGATVSVTARCSARPLTGQ